MRLTFYISPFITITSCTQLSPHRIYCPQRMVCQVSFETVVDGKPIGDLNRKNDKWENENLSDDELLERIGNFIYSQYQQPKTGTA